jgi:hypothetical protein
MERDRFFVQANHRLGGTIGFLINCQNVFHLAEVLGVQVGDGRGRDTGRPAPPAQIPTSGTTA